MLVLTRKVLEAAIAKLTLEVAVAREKANKEATKEQDKYISDFKKGLARVLKEIDVTESLFNDLAKNRGKYTIEQFNEKLNEISTGFNIYDRYFRSGYGNHRYNAEDKEKQIATLKGLLSMMEGDKLELSNSMAEKVLGKTDLLSLLG